MQDRLPMIRCPALVLHGSADGVYSVDRAHELAEGLPNAEPPVSAGRGTIGIDQLPDTGVAGAASPDGQ